MAPPTSIELPDTIYAPGLARHFVQTHAGHLPSEILHDALLLVSELVTNAVRHGAAPISVHFISVCDGTVRVEVHDAGDGIPVPTTPEAVDVGGRGLLIVAALASRWGVTPSASGPGKATWFELGSPA
jgi:anti-sigma regulatory factor (Ser/Thr protein kinase)